ncbi:hypothetical protein DET65_3708 [Sunxiuqinia elliptica]|uniref:Uncharacterized protein n=2 Tax=Sunxiuqinia elliptica TaxID=655355 RepID=A0A4R6GWM5_9BACT|nr:hypothetical protein DET52_106144 [Sunxiuqinia elliptica]TDO57123.1 hypothetical protein DET65_3708 [Sunxiuqinia elliptica]
MLITPSRYRLNKIKNMRINRFNKIVSLLSLVVLFTSCASSYKTMYIEVAKPTEHLLDNDIVSLTLMNRAMTDEFKEFPADSIQMYFYRQGFNVNAAVLDSSAADTTIKVAAELLFESGRYDVVVPEERNIPHPSNYQYVPKPLDWDYVSEICERYNTDALLVMERYINVLMTNFIQVPFSDLYEATIDSKYDAIFRIYDPRKREIVKQIMISDTIFWNEAEYSQKKLFVEKMVPVKQAINETGIQVALELESKLAPQWQTESRGYFALKDADEALIQNGITENNWQAIYKHWEQLLNENKSPGKRSKVQYNLAVASEIMGDIDQAAEWATKSYRTQYRKQTEDYLYQLKKRKKLLSQFEQFSAE